MGVGGVCAVQLSYALRGSVVIDKSFLFMALACAAGPIVGAGIYIAIHLF
jgi:hypothetical protein